MGDVLRKNNILISDLKKKEKSNNYQTKDDSK